MRSLSLIVVGSCVGYLLVRAGIAGDFGLAILAGIMIIALFAYIKAVN